MSKRKQHAPEFKAKVALEALKRQGRAMMHERLWFDRVVEGAPLQWWVRLITPSSVWV
jgi:hypothetical protein